MSSQTGSKQIVDRHYPVNHILSSSPGPQDRAIQSDVPSIQTFYHINSVGQRVFKLKVICKVFHINRYVYIYEISENRSQQKY